MSIIVFWRLIQIWWTPHFIPLRWFIQQYIILPLLDPLYSLALDSRMLRPNLTTCSSLDWSVLTKVHMVKKGEADFRPVGDYRSLNSITVPDRYSIRNIQDFSANLYGCSLFSKIHPIRVYHQIPVKPADILKTAITTLFENFEFLFIPFGLRNAEIHRRGCSWIGFCVRLCRWFIGR